MTARARISTVSPVSKVMTLRPIPLLSLLAGCLLAAYIALMVSAVLFATLQTQLAQNIQEKQIAVGKLEQSYYAQVTSLDSANPGELGYVKPAHLQYVSQAPLAGLSFAK